MDLNAKHELAQAILSTLKTREKSYNKARGDYGMDYFKPRGAQLPIPS